jgi:hypothetical protein
MAIGVVFTVVIAVVTGVVVAKWSGGELVDHRTSGAATGPPSQSEISSCNQHAAAESTSRSTTREIVAGAGVLAAGGGTLYGVNENRKNDARYRDMYASCMRARGYTG